jgi:hypothetical protein
MLSAICHFFNLCLKYNMARKPKHKLAMCPGCMNRGGPCCARGGRIANARGFGGDIGRAFGNIIGLGDVGNAAGNALTSWLGFKRGGRREGHSIF